MSRVAPPHVLRRGPSRRAAALATVVVCLLAASQVPLRAQSASDWRYFTSDDGLPESWVSRISVGPSGRVWITHGGVDRAAVYDGFTFSSLPTPGVDVRIHEAPGGRLWALHREGSAREMDGVQWRDADRWEIHPLPEAAGTVLTDAHLRPLDDERVLVMTPLRLLVFDRQARRVVGELGAAGTPLGLFRSLAQSPDGPLWVTGERAIARVTVDAGGAIALAPTMLPAGMRHALRLFETPAGSVLVSAADGAGVRSLLRLDAGRWRVAVRGSPGDGVLAGWPGADGDTWVARGTNLAFRLTVLADGAQPREVARTRVLSGQLLDVQAEAGGAFWIGTSLGLARYSPALWRTPASLLDDHAPVGALLETRAGALFALHERGLLHYERQAWREFPVNARLDTTSPDTLVELADGRLLIGALSGDGPLLFDTARRTFTTLEHPAGRHVAVLGATGDGRAWVMSFDEDRSAWIEQYDGRGFERVLDAGPAWQFVRPRQLLRTARGDVFVMPDRTGLGWLRDGTYTVIDQAQGLTGGNPFCALELADGRIWFGDRQGIVAFDGERWARVASGFQTVRSLVQSRDGSIWAASNSGVHRYVDGQWLSFTSTSGLPEGGVYDVLEDAAGRIWAATTAGLSRYHPDADADPPRALFDPAANPGEIGPSGEAVLSFAGLDRWRQTPDEDLLFSYRLDGRAWSRYEPRETVALAGLAPGSHEVELRVMDRAGNVGSTPARLPFVVLLPWYREPVVMAISVAGLLALAVAVGLFLFRHRRLERDVALRTRELAEANQRLRDELVHRERAEQEGAQLRDQLHHAQKMDAIGRLAGGVAHDFNNLLTVIGSYGEQLLEDLEKAHPSHAAAAEIVRAADRAAALTRQMLAFSRHQSFERRVLDLDAVVREISRMLTRMVGERIAIHLDADGACWPIMADRAQIEQVIVNLVVNARDAMPAGGRITIATRNVRLDDEACRAWPGADPGEFVRLSVSDPGVGMDETTQAHIFEPFFTTKEVGKGSGLGLATVYGIVRQSGGFIGVESSVGRGTTMTILLPRAAETGAPRAEGAGARAEGGRERVLVVEDEPAVRRLVVIGLSRLGYRVTEAGSAEDALARLDGDREPFDLLVTDMVMPGLSGLALAEQLGRRWPDLRVLLMSGYTEDAAAHAGLLTGRLGFLQKPFTADALATRARGLLDAASGERRS